MGRVVEAVNMALVCKATLAIELLPISIAVGLLLAWASWLPALTTVVEIMIKLSVETLFLTLVVVLPSTLWSSGNEVWAATIDAAAVVAGIVIDSRSKRLSLDLCLPPWLIPQLCVLVLVKTHLHRHLDAIVEIAAARVIVALCHILKNTLETLDFGLDGFGGLLLCVVCIVHICTILGVALSMLLKTSFDVAHTLLESEEILRNLLLTLAQVLNGRGWRSMFGAAGGILRELIGHGRVWVLDRCGLFVLQHRGSHVGGHPVERRVVAALLLGNLWDLVAN
ncbi:hypothetical protein E6O75_ATG04957 [Venturia nashicola]|uniref:Uncharacterized protein n=1 Tax=Venturia nashicola TaxID=86259 RepID=A0A4Z1NZK4_9PEZI|nr:hypothetical protein E6O75_ATG04957 [Venturia nashicola]